jgi:hypothetical protein
MSDGWRGDDRRGGPRRPPGEERNLGWAEEHDERGGYSLYGYSRNQGYDPRWQEPRSFAPDRRRGERLRTELGREAQEREDWRRDVRGRGEPGREHWVREDWFGEDRRTAGHGPGGYGPSGPRDVGGRLQPPRGGYERNRGWGDVSRQYRGQDFRGAEPRPATGERRWWERTRDEVEAWFGDEEAEFRRRVDAEQFGRHRDERSGDTAWSDSFSEPERRLDRPHHDRDRWRRGPR